MDGCIMAMKFCPYCRMYVNAREDTTMQRDTRSLMYSTKRTYTCTKCGRTIHF